MVDFQEMEQLLDAAGELHVVIEEHDQELELRKGQTTFDGSHGAIIVETKQTTEYVDSDRVVRYYVPQEIWH